MREIEGVDVKKLEHFPFSGVKVLGGVQIGLGIACMFLGMVDLVIFVMIGESTVLADKKLLEIQKTAKQLTIASTGLWCGLWVRKIYKRIYTGSICAIGKSPIITMKGSTSCHIMVI